MKTVLTYGTFDLLHHGHVRLLSRARALGDRLVVGVSTDAFNEGKGKRSLFPYEERAELVGALRWVDEVIPESTWDQKRQDILRLRADVLVMGDDWRGRFDDLSDLCEVVYLPRTPIVSTTSLKATLSEVSREQVDSLKRAVDALVQIVERIR
ncbi:MAG: Glycerol-3-phosphate cytidylyltransferase [Pseudomonadota bacterium]|jgi:glycerol-3-phosphate cytidylyltransferase